jgi:predicted dehydrogenase
MAEKSNSLCQVAYQNRFCTAMLRTRQIIQSGIIGKIINMRFTYFGSEYISTDRKLDWKIQKKAAGGGALVSLGTHCFDLIRFFTNDQFKRIFASTQRIIVSDAPFTPEVETMAQVQFRMKNETIGTVEVSQIAAGSNIGLRYEIYGEKGTICFDQSNPNILQLFRQDEEETPMGGFRGFTHIQTLQKYDSQVFPASRVDTNWLRYSTESQYQFLKSIIENRTPKPSLEDGIKVDQITQACYRSAESRSWIEL